MKALRIIAAVSLGLMGSVGSLSAQPYGGSGYGYGEGYRERGRARDRDFDEDDRERRPAYREQSGFDEREYLRCNPDVRRAISSGQMRSAFAHYQTFGRREHRRLSC